MPRIDVIIRFETDTQCIVERLTVAFKRKGIRIALDELTFDGSSFTRTEQQEEGAVLILLISQGMTSALPIAWDSPLQLLECILTTGEILLLPVVVEDRLTEGWEFEEDDSEGEISDFAMLEPARMRLV